MKHAGTFKQFVTASINILNAVIINNKLSNQTTSCNCCSKMKLHETFHYSRLNLPSHFLAADAL